MSCKLTDHDHAAIMRWAESLGESAAMILHAKGASLGAGREGALSAFTRGFDRKAEELLSDE